jgi:hypothetical protein
MKLRIAFLATVAAMQLTTALAQSQGPNTGAGNQSEAEKAKQGSAHDDQNSK